jgi:hypothetical protein
MTQLEWVVTEVVLVRNVDTPFFVFRPFQQKGTGWYTCGAVNLDARDITSDTAINRIGSVLVSTSNIGSTIVALEM